MTIKNVKPGYILICLAVILLTISIACQDVSVKVPDLYITPSDTPVVYDTPEPVLVQYSTLDAQAQKETESVRLTTDASNGFYVFPDDISDEDYQATIVARITPSSSYEPLYQASEYYAKAIDGILLIQDTYDEWEYWNTDDGQQTKKSLDVVLSYCYWAYRRANIFAAASSEYPLSIIPSLENYDGAFTIEDPLIGPNVASEDYPKLYPYQDDINNLKRANLTWSLVESVPDDFFDTVFEVRDNVGGGQVEVEAANRSLNLYSDEEMEEYKQIFEVIYNQFLTSLYS